MSQIAKVKKTLTIGNKTWTENDSTPGDGGIAVIPSSGVPAAKVGTLTTRTDANTGVITAVAGHGIADADLIDVYWTVSGGGARYGMTADVTGDAVSIDGGSGDDLPADESAVTFMKPVVEDLVINGTNCVGLAFYSTRKGRIFLSDSNSVEYSVPLTAGETVIWTIDTGVANPITGDSILTVSFSHSYSSGVATMECGAAYT